MMRDVAKDWIKNVQTADAAIQPIIEDIEKELTPDLPLDSLKDAYSGLIGLYGTQRLLMGELLKLSKLVNLGEKTNSELRERIKWLSKRIQELKNRVAVLDRVAVLENIVDPDWVENKHGGA